MFDVLNLRNWFSTLFRKALIEKRDILSILMSEKTIFVGSWVTHSDSFPRVINFLISMTWLLNKQKRSQKHYSVIEMIYDCGRTVLNKLRDDGKLRNRTQTITRYPNIRLRFNISSSSVSLAKTSFLLSWFATARKSLNWKTRNCASFQALLPYLGYVEKREALKNEIHYWPKVVIHNKIHWFHCFYETTVNWDWIELQDAA